MIKEQPKYINPDLWERFLMKRGYNGYYHKFGTKYKLVHTPYGTFRMTVTNIIDGRICD